MKSKTQPQKGILDFAQQKLGAEASIQIKGGGGASIDPAGGQ